MATQLQRPTPVFPALQSVYDSLAIYTELILRIGLAGVLIPKGMQKVFGLLGGGGLGGTAAFFDKIGYSPGIILGPLVAFTELIGGILLLIGLFVRPAALAVVIFMVFAIHYTAMRGGWFWGTHGAEFPWLIFITALVLLVRGGGRMSLDRKLGREF